MAERAFEIIDRHEDEPETPAKTSSREDTGTAMLMLGLQTLSKRTLAAVADLFTLVTVGSAFWLWYSIHEPNPYQLVSLAMYGVFVLTINWIIRRK